MKFIQCNLACLYTESPSLKEIILDLFINMRFVGTHQHTPLDTVPCDRDLSKSLV